MSAFADLPRRWRLLLEDGDEVLATTLVNEPRRALKVEIPAGGTERHTLADQLIVLERDHVGRPLATLCHAALIVLIRREIALDAALDRFFALWDHHEALLLASLSFRWLVSAADTLVDHGRSPAERGTAFGVVLFANTLKLYETERVFSQSLDPSEADLERQTPGYSLDGIVPFRVQRGDTIGNMVKRKDRLIGDLGLAGRLLDQAMQRANAVDTVYSRFRKLHKSRTHAW